MLFTLFDNLVLGLVSCLVKARELFSLEEISNSSVFSILIVFFFVLNVTLCYKLKRQMMPYFCTMYNCKYSRIFVDEISESSKQFDCFISYCPQDKDTAVAILEELGKKPPYYTFCTRDRNWAVGSYIPTNVIQSVLKSRKTLMIVSEEFAKTRWFHLQFQMAFHQVLQDNDHRLILVRKDLPEEASLPTDVRYYLDTRSSLQWGDTWFWERLKYSLEDDYNKDTEHKNTVNYRINGLHDNDEAFSELLENIVI